MRVTAPAILVAGAMGAACQLLAGIEQLHTDRADATADDAQGAATVPEASAPGAVNDSGCIGPTWPARPMAAASSSDDDVNIIAAMNRFDIGFGPGHPDAGCPISFDLDDAATGLLSPGSNAKGPSTCRGHGVGTTIADELGGRDNSFGRLMKIASQMLSVKSPYIFDPNKQVLAGETTIIFQVTGYNGTDNDAEVAVTVFISGGLLDDAGALMTPKFVATEKWTIDPRSIELENMTSYLGRYRTLEAYVTNGTLVAQMNLAPVPVVLAGEMSIIEVSRVVMTARLVRSGGSYKLEDGVVGGRATTRAVLSTLGHVKDPTFDPDAGGGERFCERDPAGGLRNILTNATCTSADINENGIDDGTGPCDSLSVGFGFSAVPALYEGKHARLQAAGCEGGASWSDECPNDFRDQ